MSALTAWGAMQLVWEGAAELAPSRVGGTLTFALSTDTATIDPSITGSDHRSHHARLDP